MRKLIVLAAFGLWTTPAFAQTATVTQQGDYSTATIEQTGGAHVGTILTHSNAAGAAQGNDALIRQTSASGDIALIKQGVLNGQTTKQASAEIFQGDNDGSFGANSAMIFQRSGRVHRSEIFQTGSGNTADTYMYSHQGFYEYTKIDQNGFNNLAYQLKDDEREGSLIIEQDNLEYGAVGNTAYQYTRKDQARDLFIRQVGDENQATQDIFKGSYATTRQFGYRNAATMTTPGHHSNDLTVLQGDESGGAMSSDNEATIYAAGGFNTAVVEQYGDGANFTGLNMADGATANVLQDGLGNSVFGLAGGTSSANVLGGSGLGVMQVGDGNEAFVDMTSAAGTASVSQTGSANTATVIQN